MEKVEIEKFIAVVIKAQQSGKTFSLELSPLKVTGLHGALTVAMKHPRVANEMQDTYEMLQEIREQLCQIMVEMGFTEEEVEFLDKTEM